MLRIPENLSELALRKWEIGFVIDAENKIWGRFLNEVRTCLLQAA